MSTNQKPVRPTTGDKIYLASLGTLAIICIGCLVGLMHRNLMHGVITAVVLAVETLVIGRFVVKMDHADQDPTWKSLAFGCSAMWGIGLGTVVGLMEWSLAVGLLIGGCWAVIGFLFGILLYKVDKNEKKAKAAKAAAEAQANQDQPKTE